MALAREKETKKYVSFKQCTDLQWGQEAEAKAALPKTVT